VLSDDEIERIAGNCECSINYFVAMTVDRVELFGSAEYQIVSE